MATFQTKQNLNQNQLTLTFMFNIKSSDNKNIKRQAQCIVELPKHAVMSQGQAKNIEDIFNRRYSVHAVNMLETHSKHFTHAEYMAALTSTPAKTLSTSKISQQALIDLNDLAQKAQRGILRSEIDINRIFAPSGNKVSIDLSYTI